MTARRRSVTGARHARTPATSRRSAMLVVRSACLAISGSCSCPGGRRPRIPRRVAETTPPTSGGPERAGTGIAATETAGVDGIVGTSDDSTVSTGDLVAAAQAGPGGLVPATLTNSPPGSVLPLGPTAAGAVVVAVAAVCRPRIPPRLADRRAAGDVSVPRHRRLPRRRHLRPPRRRHLRHLRRRPRRRRRSHCGPPRRRPRVARAARRASRWEGTP